MRVNQTLAAMFRVRHGGAEPPQTDSDDWKAWLRSELAAPRAEPLSYDGLPPEAAETLERSGPSPACAAKSTAKPLAR